MRQRGRSNTGFTLVELMVTVAIIGIAAAVAMPSVSMGMADRRLQGHAITFMNVFREARSRALMRGRAHLVLVDTTGASTVQTIAEGSASSCLLSTTWAIVFRNLELEASTRTQVRTPTGAVTEFCFTPAGRAFYRVNRAGPFVEDDEIINANRIRGGMLYTVADLEQPELVVRRVFVPAAGVPRLAPGVIP